MPRQGRSSRRAQISHEVPEVFQDMLANEGTSSPTRTDEEGKAVKKRRIGGRVVVQAPAEATSHQDEATEGDTDLDELFEEPSAARQQIVKSDSEDSADSDADWEEVDIPLATDGEQAVEGPKNEGLDIVLEPSKVEANRARNINRRKPLSVHERRLRLEVHKLHICCLLAHTFIRNHWCNDETIHTALRRLLSSKTVSYLNPGDGKTQFQRSRSFMDGLEQANNAFRAKFKIDSKGLHKPRWADDSKSLLNFQTPKDAELPLQFEDFVSTARNLKASRDTGAQLFCALLRSAGVDARLVCSLQCLPLHSSPPASDAGAAKYGAVYSAENARRSTTPDNSAENGERRAPAHLQSNKSGDRSIRESKYPVFWVEVFNEAVQKWVTIDPLVTNTTNKPSKMEPPAGDQGNNLTYVVVFEDDGTGRDVTRRYAKAYNAKTRRDRVESIKGGQKWWRRVMRLFRRRHQLDRDQLEDAELTSKEAAEPMPKNVQDFKNHPYYALERHLKRHEVIHPRREVGKIGAGKSGGSNLVESIFRRRDVQTVQSADKWFRMGREIKEGEQPLKRAPARRNRDQSADMEEENASSDDAGVGLYASFQTAIYKAPPVINGQVPRNTYGNLDIYVPTMVPPGGAHIQHPETTRAARLLGIDFAEAVTGFSFKGRHGSAIVKGAVVAAGYREAVLETLRAFEDEQAQVEEQQKTYEALRMWKRMFTGLRVKERIEGYHIEGEERVEDQAIAEDEDVDESPDVEGAGGFFPGEVAAEAAKPTAGRDFAENTDFGEDGSGGGFSVSKEDGQDEDTNSTRDRFLDDFEDDQGGGFLVDNDGDEDEFDKDFAPSLPATSNNLPGRSAILTSTTAPESGSASEKDGGGGGSPTTSPSAQPNNPDPFSSLSREELAEARLLQRLQDGVHASPSPPSRPTQQAANPGQSTSHPDPVETGITRPLSSVAPTDQTIDIAQTTSNIIDSADTSRPLQTSSSSVETPKVTTTPPPAALISNEQPRVATSSRITVPPEEEEEKEKEVNAVLEGDGDRSGIGSEGESESDKGSLLSEDPEDEDAEPDWIA